jgi:hypothetical protein
LPPVARRGVGHELTKQWSRCWKFEM